MKELTSEQVTTVSGAGAADAGICETAAWGMGKGGSINPGGGGNGGLGYSLGSLIIWYAEGCNTNPDH